MSSFERSPLAVPSAAGESSTGSGPRGQNPGGNPNFSNRPKRTLIESACAACRRRKSKVGPLARQHRQLTNGEDSVMEFGKRNAVNLRAQAATDGLLGSPTCTRCQSLNTECVYEAQEGESRWSALRRRSQSLEAERDDLRGLLNFLRDKPEQEALAAFYRIRSGGFEHLLPLIRQARQTAQSGQDQPPATPDPAEATRLPPIRTMFDVAAQTQSQAGSAAPARSRLPSYSSDGSSASHSSTFSARSQPRGG